MTWKHLAARAGGLALLAFLGGTLFAVTFNALVFFGAIPQDAVESGAFTPFLLRNAALVWMGATALGIASLFIRESWRSILYYAPLYAPSLYAALIVLMGQ